MLSFPYRIIIIMAKRKLDRSCSSENFKPRFDIPALLKTEQILVDARGNIKTEPPCTISNKIPKTSLDQCSVVLTCEGCGISGNHCVGPGYRLVKTAMFVENGTQTDYCGGGSLIDIKTESIDPFYYDSVPPGSEVGVLDHEMAPVKMEYVDASNKDPVHTSYTVTPPFVHTSSTATPPVVDSSDDGCENEESEGADDITESLIRLESIGEIVEAAPCFFEDKAENRMKCKDCPRQRGYSLAAVKNEKGHFTQRWSSLLHELRLHLKHPRHIINAAAKRRLRDSELLMQSTDPVKMDYVDTSYKEPVHNSSTVHSIDVASDKVRFYCIPH
eukprot:sb/3466670/